MSNSELIFPYYSGNIYKSKCLGNVSLDYFIRTIKKPKPKFEDLFKSIKLATEKKDTKLKRKLKQKLYSFTPSVLIDINYERCYANILEYTGLMQIDFDGLDSLDDSIQLKHHVFNNYEQIVCSFLSPSGKGVKCLMKIKKPENLEEYKALHKAMVNSFESYSYLDTATKNAVLPMFLSNDKNILYRELKDCLEWSETDYSKPNYVRLNEEPNLTIKTEDKDYFYAKVVRIINKRFSNILDNGHPQVRSTCLVLGSRVAAGYIDRSDAENLAKINILSNNYLQKNINGYLKTAYWAINEGMKSPKYF